MEDFVRPHTHVDVQIAGGRAVAAGFAFAGQADALAVVDAGGNADVDGFAAFHHAVATALQAGVFDFLARAVAGRTGLLHLENRLAHVDGARAVAGAAGGGAGAGFGAGTVADAAFFVAGHGNLFFQAGSGFFQRNFDAVLQVFALIAGLATATAAEHLAEDVAEVKTLRAAETAKAFKTALAAAGFKGAVAELVVGGFFLRVGQNIVGFLDFFEFFFGRRVAGIAVGMVFHRQLAVGFFDFVGAGGAGNAERFVIVLLAHGVFKIGLNNRWAPILGRRRQSQGSLKGFFRLP